MKRSMWIRLLSVVLVFSLVVPSASAASFGSTYRFGGGWFQDFWNGIFGDKEPEETEPAETEPETTAPAEPETTAPAETEPETKPAEPGDVPKLVLVEGKDTVENGEMLRAETYEVVADAAAPMLMAARDGQTKVGNQVIKYFGSTLFNYDDRINQATHRLELEQNPDLQTWEGIYFTNGAADRLTYGTTEVQPVNPNFDRSGKAHFNNGQYILVNVKPDHPAQALVADGNGVKGNVQWKDATVFTLTRTKKGSYNISADGKGLKIQSSIDGTKMTSWADPVEIVRFGGDSSDPNLVMLKQGDLYLNRHGAHVDLYAGYDDEEDAGSTFYLYPASARNPESASVTHPLAEYNRWTGRLNDSTGNNIYSGLVQKNLTTDGQLVFNHPDAGVFNNDASVKDVYTNVGIPFQYTKEGNKYSFDASEFGAYFNGTPGSNQNLGYHETPQNTTQLNSGDGRAAGWFPFNNTDTITRDNVDYHFGMKTTIPFNMTANGRLNATDDRSTPITFSFSGDDDVWVFIDGQLVLDLGGVHNAIDGELNFAENTWRITANRDQATKPTKDAANKLKYNGQYGAITGKIFADGTGDPSQLNMDRNTFAATANHELTIFYLERGMGSSNCKIEFNLPMLDAVSVYKQIDEKWTSTGAPGEGTVEPLTPEEQAVINNIDFGFTLYKKDGNDFRPVANTKYSLMNADGQVIGVPATDSKGHFTLRNGQAARFTGGISKDGDTYYVAEDNMNAVGFVAPDYDFAGTAANGFDVDGRHYTAAREISRQVLTNQPDGTPYESHKVTVNGGDESKDTLVFVCRNYVDATLPETSAKPIDDKIVLDYGLGVQIDVLKNDLLNGDRHEIIAVGGADLTVDEAGNVTQGTDPQFGTAQIVDDHIEYQLNKPLDHVEVLTYAVKVSSTKTEAGGTTLESHDYGTAKVYIIPATTMYYEEDFAGLVQYGKSNPGTPEGTPAASYQEPGVVGTVDDSPYGSDAAYIHSSSDSNGTFHHFDTSEKAAHFRYTFTGTETSFFARTSATSGYMRIRITDAEGNQIHQSYRNTIYQDQDSAVKGPLYNIPVFTWDAEQDGYEYGTYTVTVSVSQANADLGYGADFWLDGVRVVNPLSPDDENYEIAQSAYASDGEANMTHATLRDKLLTEAEQVPATDDDGNEIMGEDGDTLMKPQWKGDNFILFTDINGKMITAEDYQSIGPKEEVYLHNGQSVTFSLKNWDPNTNKLFLGMKAPTGSAAVKIGTQSMTIDNAADCFYDISKLGTITNLEDGTRVITFTIKADPSSLVSLTNIKVTGAAEFTIIDSGYDNPGEGGEIIVP